MTAIGGCGGLGGIFLFFLMRDDEWSRCQLSSAMGLGLVNLEVSSPPREYGSGGFIVVLTCISDI